MYLLILDDTALVQVGKVNDDDKQCIIDGCLDCVRFNSETQKFEQLSINEDDESESWITIDNEV